ncbi:MAG: type I-MYXAN CRISPR-associated protein Cas6/Cmx6 [Pseudanabaenales cyanobacterium]|nr:type I-MYXAN CRISPR-associated protein Cas6/Cmx6 [Pseudanabaenales cyanobacterium]
MITSINVWPSPDASDGIEPLVELAFPVRGKSLPADHNYGLYSTLVGCVPALHQQTHFSLLTVAGFPDRQGEITLTPYSCFKIRVSVSQIPLVYQLAGKQVDVGKHKIQIGIPKTTLLKPAPRLRSRIVTIKGYMEPEPFLLAAQRQLDRLGVSGDLSIPINREGRPSRKTIKIKCFTVVGFTTAVSELSPADSLKLQTYGLGGKRSLGCGYFIPWKGGGDV